MTVGLGVGRWGAGGTACPPVAIGSRRTVLRYSVPRLSLVSGFEKHSKQPVPNCPEILQATISTFVSSFLQKNRFSNSKEIVFRGFTNLPILKKEKELSYHIQIF